MFGFSAGEMLLIVLIALLLFGNEKLPQNIKKFLKGWNQTKKVAFDMQKSWHEIKLDLKNNVELYDSGEIKIENSGEKTALNGCAKPVNPIVSQDEIDTHQLASEKEIKQE